ncbi:hypothetical protein CEXT_382971 [Caerostris extrusa]|uniref:Uncharacterized protein n=1 Tax=Caerostris extrusa TaxID=172846 RepID=A0AAV4PA26_CAEEX|nr:hypothetical protein CEXT_382971 [Caerostris extrusa]
MLSRQTAERQVLGQVLTMTTQSIISFSEVLSTKPAAQENALGSLHTFLQPGSALAVEGVFAGLLSEQRGEGFSTKLHNAIFLIFVETGETLCFGVAEEISKRWCYKQGHHVFVPKTRNALITSLLIYDPRYLVA